MRDQCGPEALAVFAGTRTGTISKNGIIRIFTQMWGTPNVEGTDPFCAASKHVAYELTQGSPTCPNSYTAADLGSASLYVYFGENQAEARPVYFGMINDWRITNGARMVVVDPRYTVTASKADRWLPIRSGTDLALALALAHHILSNDFQDKAFCEKHVEGWERWRDFIFARGYTPEWAAPLTGIPAAEIRRLAEEIAAADGCVLFGSRGINQHTNAVQTNRALMFLAAITGNWGRRGGAFLNLSIGAPISASAPASRQRPPQRPMVRRSPVGWVEAMRQGRPYPIKALVCCNNPHVQLAGAGGDARSLPRPRSPGARRSVRERDLGLRRLRAALRHRHREGRHRPLDRRPAGGLDRQDDRAPGRGEVRRLDLDRARQALWLRRRAAGQVQGSGAILGRDVHR